MLKTLLVYLKCLKNENLDGYDTYELELIRGG